MLSGPLSLTQGIATNPALEIELVFLPPDSPPLPINIDNFGLDRYSAADVGCSGATQPGGSCNFSLALEVELLSAIVGSGDYETTFRFFDAAGSSYSCQKNFSLRN